MAGGSDSDGQIDSVMKEKRLFAPPAEFAKHARIKSLAEYQELWDEAAADPAKFWADLAPTSCIGSSRSKRHSTGRSRCPMVCRRKNQRLVQLP